MTYKYTVTNAVDPDEMPLTESFHSTLTQALDAMMSTIGSELSGEAGPGDKILKKVTGTHGGPLEYYEVALVVTYPDTHLARQEFRLVIQLEKDD
jgi:hypothetical protein